ncbi:hypothetical protein LAUMK35_05827 [Mycobacterium pseudokansasii]|nr:hypothetical protein LAUMK35_05827 [Mycobacterium pseudokansasii]VBA36186.1 hypothetical protein LAUMK21_05806 [Mycobacterium pseudokansasii]
MLGGVGEGFESDCVAKGLQLFDGFCFGLPRVVSGGVVGAGVVVEGAVDHHVPGVNEHAVFDSDHGDQGGHRRAAGFAAVGCGGPVGAGDAAVAGVVVGVFGTRCRQRGHPESGFEVAVAGAGGGRFDPARRFVAAGHHRGPRRQMGSGGKHAHVRAGLGDKHIGDDVGKAWDTHQQFPGGLKGFDRLLDALLKAGDVGAVGVDAIQIQPSHKRVMVAKRPAQRLGRCGDLLTRKCEPLFGQIGEHHRITLPADQRLQHRPPRDPDDVGGHRRQFDPGIFERLFQPLDFFGARSGDGGARPGQITQHPNRLRRHGTRRCGLGDGLGSVCE